MSSSAPKDAGAPEGRSGVARQDAEFRGDIDAGLHGDKKQGFDPAAAPMETDAEAGATQRVPVAAPGTQQSFRTGRTDMQDSDGDAMRSMPGANRSPVREIGRASCRD